MKKRWTAALCLALCLALLTGCASTEGLKKVPQGQRPESMNMEELEPQFPSDSSLKNEMMMLASEISAAKDIDQQRELYDQFLYEAYIYIVGPYNFTSYLSADGRSISAYYENLVNHMNTFLSEYEPAAWMAIGQSSWGAQLKAEYDKRMCTPESIRTAYPVTDETGQKNVQAMYTARDAYVEAAEAGFAEADQESLLDDLLTSRETLAASMDYDSYLDFVVERRDRMPYDLSDLKALCALVREYLAPAVSSAGEKAAPALTAEQWNQALPALAQRLPDYAQDLGYVLENGVYTVEEAGEGEESRHFSYMLYQYDVSAGKAVLAGQPDDGLHVLRGLGLAARDMALESDQWSISALTFYDEIQKNAFAGACLNELDAIYGEEGQAAAEALALEMARDVCSAAMELEYLCALYDDPIMAQDKRQALWQELAAAYGLEGDPDYLTTSQDLILGDLSCAGRMLGGLYGLKVWSLGQQDEKTAEEVLAATLSVYNQGNPIAAGYAAGLGNPYSAEGVQALAQLLN